MPAIVWCQRQETSEASGHKYCVSLSTTNLPAIVWCQRQETSEAFGHKYCISLCTTNLYLTLKSCLRGLLKQVVLFVVLQNIFLQIYNNFMWHAHITTHNIVALCGHIHFLHVCILYMLPNIMLSIISGNYH